MSEISHDILNGKREAVGLPLLPPTAADQPTTEPSAEQIWQAWHGTDEPWAGCADHEAVERVTALLAPAPQPAPDTERGERLRGIRERIDAATAGAWIVDEVGEVVQPAEDDAHRFDIMDLRIAKAHESKADVAFIAAARTDVPWLLAEITRLDAVVTAVRGIADRAEALGDAVGNPALANRAWRIATDLRALDGGAS